MGCQTENFVWHIAIWWMCCMENNLRIECSHFECRLAGFLNGLTGRVIWGEHFLRTNRNWKVQEGIHQTLLLEPFIAFNKHALFSVEAEKYYLPQILDSCGFNIQGDFLPVCKINRHTHAVVSWYLGCLLKFMNNSTLRPCLELLILSSVRVAVRAEAEGCNHTKQKRKFQTET